MLNTETSTDTEFWSETYGERSIAIFNHHGRWLAYLDQVLQKEDFRDCGRRRCLADAAH